MKYFIYLLLLVSLSFSGTPDKNSLSELKKRFEFSSTIPSLADTVQVVIQIPKGWHLTSNNPEDELLIALTSSLKGAEFEFGDPVYPAAIQTYMPELEINGSWFEDSLVIKFPVSKSTAKTWSDLEFSMYFQACTDKMCLPPREETQGYKQEVKSIEPVQSDSKKSMILMLFFAFLGGVILNFMPCVLPVLGLKVFSLINQSNESPRRLFFLGVNFVFGVLASFLTLASVIIIMQKAGHLAGWGFQFTQPLFVITIIVLVILFALNLFGLFEVSLSSEALTGMDGASKKEGYLGAFFNGAFMTLMSTPCSAPFLGPAMGYGLSQPPSILILFFLTAGMGLALPFFLMTSFPKLIKFLPKPGPWMLVLKDVMAFLLLLTASWLLYVLSNQVGSSTTFKFVSWLVILSMSVSIWGRLTHGKNRFSFFKILMIVVFLIGLCWSFAKGIYQEMGTKSSSSPNKEFSLSQVDALNKEGKWVFVDFTADWCISCKVNEKTALAPQAVQEYFGRNSPTFLVADYTHGNLDIDKELKRNQRGGIPVYILYSPNRDQDYVFPELITEQMVLDVFKEKGL
ncbi:thioredoxin family protein [bacterium]|nr:thioredoxin family protein [bacterium]